MLLPDAEPTEIIINWINKHVENSVTVPTTTPVIQDKADDCISDGFNSFHSSSADETDDEVAKKRIPVENITFRKVYRKTRRISRDSSIRSTKSTETTPVAKRNEHNKYAKNLISNESCPEDFTKIVNFSNESGIELLANSNIISPSQSKELNLSLDIVKPVEFEKKDSSSDYMTCTSTSVNTFERNISNLMTSDESHSLSIAKSEGIGSDASLVHISELYKFVDPEEGIVLYERRFLKTPSECNGSLKGSSISSKLSSLPETIDYDTDTLRKELTVHGYNPGPITVTTKRVYLKKLRQLKKQPLIISQETVKKKGNFFDTMTLFFLRNFSSKCI